MKSDSKKQSKNFKLFLNKIYRMLGGMAGVIFVCFADFVIAFYFSPVFWVMVV